jgi:hypothetical protein
VGSTDTPAPPGGEDDAVSKVEHILTVAGGLGFQFPSFCLSALAIRFCCGSGQAGGENWQKEVNKVYTEISGPGGAKQRESICKFLSLLMPQVLHRLPNKHRHKAGFASNFPGKLLFQVQEGTPPVVEVEVPDLPDGSRPKVDAGGGKLIDVPKKLTWNHTVVWHVFKRLRLKGVGKN